MGLNATAKQALESGHLHLESERVEDQDLTMLQLNLDWVEQTIC